MTLGTKFPLTFNFWADDCATEATNCDEWAHRNRRHLVAWEGISYLHILASIAPSGSLPSGSAPLPRAAPPPPLLSLWGSYCPYCMHAWTGWGRWRRAQQTRPAPQPLPGSTLQTGRPAASAPRKWPPKVQGTKELMRDSQATWRGGGWRQRRQNEEQEYGSFIIIIIIE